MKITEDLLKTYSQLSEVWSIMAIGNVLGIVMAVDIVGVSRGIWTLWFLWPLSVL